MINPDAVLPAGCNEDSLLVLDYNTKHHTMIFQYKLGSIYDTRDLIAYAEDASEGKTHDILVIECPMKGDSRTPELKHHLHKTKGAGWHALAITSADAVKNPS